MIAGALEAASLDIRRPKLSSEQLELLRLVDPKLNLLNHLPGLEQSIEKLVALKFITTSGSMVEWRDPYLQKAFRTYEEEVAQKKAAVEQAARKKEREEQAAREKERVEQAAREKRWWPLW